MESDDAGTLLARLKLEGSSTKADVVLGLDTNLIADAKATGLFAPHGVDTSGLDLPVAWTDETFVPFDWGWFAFVYDETSSRTRRRASRNSSKPSDGPKIVIQDPRTSTPGLGLLLWMRGVYGDEAGEAWRKLAPKIVTVTHGLVGGLRPVPEGRGRHGALLHDLARLPHRGREGRDEIKAAIFPEGHYLQVEVAGMTKATDDAGARPRIPEFMSDGAVPVGDPGRQLDVSGEAAGGRPAGLLPGPRQAGEIALRRPEEVEKNRRAWVDEWLAAMSR